MAKLKLTLMTILIPFILVGQSSTKLDFVSEGDSIFQITQTTVLSPTNKEGFQTFLYNELVKDLDRIASLQWEQIQIQKTVGEKRSLLRKAGVDQFGSDVDTLLSSSMNGSWLYNTNGKDQLITITDGKIMSQKTAVGAVTHKSRMMKEVNFDFFGINTSVIMVSKDGNTFLGPDNEGRIHSFTRVADQAVPTN